MKDSMFCVGIICKTFLRGGAEKQALLLAKLLTENGHKAFLINWQGEKIDKRYLDFIHEHSIRYFPLSGNFIGKFMKFQKLIREKNIRIITSYLTLSNFLSGMFKLNNRELICIGGIRNDKLPWHKFFIEKLVHNYCNDATVFNNYSAEAKFSGMGFNPKKICVIQNAIYTGSNQVRTKERNDGEVRIVTVGRFVRQKDYATALNSFKTLITNSEDKKYKYYIAGYGPLENKIRSLIRKLHLDSRVEVLVDPGNVSEILAGCDIFLSTSLFEGVSNSIMEAMAVGLPIVATRVGDNRFLVKDGFNGYLVSCRDVGTIAEKLENLAESDGSRRELGRNSIKIIENEFSQQKLLESYIRLFSKFNRPLSGEPVIRTTEQMHSSGN